MLFDLNDWVLAILIALIMFGATAGGIVLGRYIHQRREGLREPLTLLQGSLVGLVALLLAFGLSMAVSRYDARREALVDEANTIGTTYLRAQTLAEPVRSESLTLLREYTDARLALSDSVPGSLKFATASGNSVAIQNDLWRLAGVALNEAPQDSAPRLYVETLNEMIDAHTTRVAALNNRLPTPVVWLQILAAALALGVLGLVLASHERGPLTALIAAGLVTLVVLVILDLDRPHRGLTPIPNRALVALRATMDEPPAAAAPGG